MLKARCHLLRTKCDRHKNDSSHTSPHERHTCICNKLKCWYVYSTQNFVVFNFVSADQHMKYVKRYPLQTKVVVFKGLFKYPTLKGKPPPESFLIYHTWCILCSWKAVNTSVLHGLTLYRAMMLYGVIRLMFLYDQSRQMASWILTYLCGFPPKLNVA